MRAVIIGEKGSLVGSRDKEVKKSIEIYCERNGITLEEFNKNNLSVYTIEFKDGTIPYVNLNIDKDVT